MGPASPKHRPARSAREAVERSLARISSLDGELHSLIHVAPRSARDAADAIDSGRAPWSHAPLAGVPLIIKDNICIRAQDCDDGPTTAASRMLAHFRSPYSATVVERLANAGAIIIAKSNLDEFGMGSSGENSAFGPARNPWDPSRVPGGSSSGSCAAVAADLAPVALGSDTGGSIRLPASMCGVVGIKPTYGSVSRYGLIAFASSLDQIGPIGRTVKDAANVLAVIAGHDPRDSTSSRLARPDPLSRIGEEPQGMIIGLPVRDPTGIDAAVWSTLQQTADILTAAGARLVDVDLPHMRHAVAAYYIISSAEASSNLARYDGIRYGHRAESPTSIHDLVARSRAEGLGEEVQRRIMLGTFALSAGYFDRHYMSALKVRRIIRDEHASLLKPRGRCDALLLPVSPTPAFPIGAKSADPLDMYLQDVFTVGASLAGFPAISVPAGFTTGAKALPIGMQLIGPPFSEDRLISLAAAIERRAGCVDRHPLLR